MTAAERTGMRVEVPSCEGAEAEGPCRVCAVMAEMLPDVRELFRSHGELFRENAQLKIDNDRLRRQVQDMQAERVREFAAERMDRLTAGIPRGYQCQ